MLRKRLLRFPGGSVDALQLLAVLVTSPVGARNALELEVPEISRRRDVRTSAQVDELLGVSIHAHRCAVACLGAEVRLDLVATDSTTLRGNGLDDLDLERLVGEEAEPRSFVVFLAIKGLILTDDGPHLGVDPGQVLICEVRTARKLEVVVEATLDDRADREVRPRPQLRDRLRHHMSRRVPQDVAARVARRPDGFDDRPIAKRCLEVHEQAVDRRRHDPVVLFSSALPCERGRDGCARGKLHVAQTYNLDADGSAVVFASHFI